MKVIMDLRKALAAILFIIAFSPLGTLQNVPDDVVYTEMKKTLVNGYKGLLTCRFKGAPNAVFWKKGSDPEKAPVIITWSYGEKLGPRYEDGSCDIDENYSLIIKNVKYEDEGRYICRVSTYKGILEHNFTDVTVTSIAVKTEPNVAVQMGKVGVLPCKVLIRPRKVSWVKGVNSTLVTLNLSGGVIDINGPEHGGIFNMTKDFSLIITDVTLQQEDYYFCEVIEFGTDHIYRDLTALEVYAQPTAPFPTIEGCPLEDHTNCIITTGSSITLTCHVDKYYPDINLFFMHGSKTVEPLTTQTWNNSDGTKNRSITISADKSRDAYKCIASGIPGLGPNDEDSASVRLFQEQGISLILTVIFVLIVICLTGVLLTWMKLRKRGKRLSKEDDYMEVPNEEKEELQDKDVQRTMRVLTRNHCEKLKKIIKASGAKLQIMSPTIARENNEVLFDTQKMLLDWWEDVACSNYDKRRKLENVLQKGSKDTESTVPSYKGSDPWISDEELKIISRYLDSASMASLCEKLCISTLPEHENAGQKGRFETLCVWRESVTESEWISMYGHLRNALGEVGILGLLAPLKDNPIHKAEYVDIALTLLMGDIIPAARALGINDNKLSVYRPVFEPTHLKKGTIGLVAHFVESTNREKARIELCSCLREVGFPLAIARNILVHRMAYGELLAISEEMKKCPCKQRENESNNAEEKSPGEGDSFLRKDTSLEMETPVEKLQEEEAMAKRHLTEIKKMLKLSDMTDEDQAECLNPKECDDEFAWFRIWKEVSHLAVFKERAAIIQGLFDMQRDDIARSVAEGNYYNTEMSLPFLQYIVMKITKDEMLRLAEVFKLKKELEGAKDSDDLAHVASGIIHGSIGKNKFGLIKLLKAKEDKALIDKLVENGFLDIAQELTIIQK